MKKRGNLGISKYISQNLKKGYSRNKVKEALLASGYDEEFIDEQFTEIRNRKIMAYSLTGLMAIWLRYNFFHKIYI